jgi:LPXTG-site transpeptidase (sortase) family protein
MVWTMKRVQALTGNLLLFVSLAAFIWCGAFLLRAHREQIRAGTVLNGETSVHSSDRRLVNVVQPDGPLGRIDIPRVGISSVILEGVDKDTLALSVGHVPGTALPGSDGNVALAAHRDTFFRGLEHIRAGDDIRLTSIGGDRAYQVDSARVVAPTDVYVLKETGSPC